MTRDKNPADVAARLRDGVAPKDKIAVEPGADKRLANIFAKTLNTPPRHEMAKARKPKSK